jgi:hypothetical protein
MGVTVGVTIGIAALGWDSISIDGGISNDAGSNTAGSGGSVGVATSTGSKRKELIGEDNSTDSFWTAQFKGTESVATSTGSKLVSIDEERGTSIGAEDSWRPGGSSFGG